MNKNITYIILLVFFIIVSGYFLVGNNQDSSGNLIGTGEVQEITLGMKNFNYYPDIINVKAGNKVRINLDNTVYGCLKSFTIREFGVSKYFRSLNDYVEFVPDKKGTFSFSCSMGMAGGKLIVK